MDKKKKGYSDAHGQTNDKGYNFINEKILQKQYRLKESTMKTIFTCFLAIVFGVIACAMFVISKPYMEMYFGEDLDAVIIPTDQPVHKEKETTEIQNQTEPIGNESIKDIEDKIQELLNDRELLTQDYQMLKKDIMTVGQKAAESMVLIHVHAKADEQYGSISTVDVVTVGFIIDLKSNIIIVTDYQSVANANKMYVELPDGNLYEGRHRGLDQYSGLAIIHIPSSKVDEKVKSELIPVTLGNSNMVTVGDIVISIGAMNENGEYMAAGSVVSTSNHRTTIDTYFKEITTDIVRIKNNKGFLVNLKGEIVGVLSGSDTNEDDLDYVVSATAISDVKTIIERLSNGRRIAHLGILGKTVTDRMREISGEELPDGLYISEIVQDSPAYKNGIMRGHILIRIGNSDITSMEDVKAAIINLKQGDTVKIAAYRKGKENYVEESYTVELE